MWGSPVHQDRANDIEQRLEGWSAGVVMAFYPLPGDLERALLKGRAGPEALFQALAESLVDAQMPPLREFLLTSSLHAMTPDLLGAILAVANPHE